MDALPFCTASPYFFLPSLSLSPSFFLFLPPKLSSSVFCPVEHSQSRGQTLRESTLKAFRNWSSSTYPRERFRTPQRELTWIIRRKGNSIIFCFYFPLSPSVTLPFSTIPLSIIHTSSSSSSLYSPLSPSSPPFPL